MAILTKPITILVLNFNGKKYLKQCLDSLTATDYPDLQIVVIDNGSTDGSTEFIKSNYPSIKMIEHNHNYGFARAYNLVINDIENEYITLINNDVVVEPGWIKELIVHAENNDVAAVVPKMKFLKDETHINAAGGNCDLYGVGWNRGNGEVDKGQYNTIQEVFYGNGAALLIKRKVWREIGPFDERYFMYGEDLDWCWRAKLKGYKVIYVPHAEVNHHWRGSGGAMINSLEKHWLSTVLKNYSLKTLILLMPKYLALKALKTVWLIACGEGNEKLTVLRSFFWNLVNLRKTLEERTRIQRLRRVTDIEIQKQMFKGSFEMAVWLKKLEHPILKCYSRM